MKLGEKLRHLREVEGSLRGLHRPLSQMEVVRGLKNELGRSISQSYLSQIENGTRPNVTAATRDLLARFFKVHPGYLVNDPEGFDTELVSALRTSDDALAAWLAEGAERFRHDGEIRAALEAIARRPALRRCLILIGALMEISRDGSDGPNS
jgi:transcriptional regulator with XRE-family HTH domain